MTPTKPEQPPRAPKHVHAEAFMHMLYRTDDGKQSEVIWNSRDGVTPFCVDSRNGKTMRHVNWDGDRYDPLHVPKSGERIFVDATPELVREEVEKYVDKHWNHKQYPMSGMFDSREEAIQKLIEDWTKPGSPWLKEVI